MFSGCLNPIGSLKKQNRLVFCQTIFFAGWIGFQAA